VCSTTRRSRLWYGVYAAKWVVVVKKKKKAVYAVHFMFLTSLWSWPSISLFCRARNGRRIGRQARHGLDSMDLKVSLAV
jgi:hypothetical protein